jgi:hypothetical protein
MNILKAIISIAIFTCSANAFAGVSQTAWDFEQDRGASKNNGASDWFFTGGAGLDNGKGLEYMGKGNAWVRNTTGWNAINNWVSVSAPNGSSCTASAWLRTSDTLTDGYMTVRDADKADGSGRIIHEIKLVGARSPGEGNIKGYRLEQFEFKMGASFKVLFYIGLHGVGKDAWIQIDDAAITCRTQS